MKKNLLLIACALVLTIACKSGANTPQSVSGIITDASMNTISIQDSLGQTVSFSTVDADKTEGNGLTLGTKAEIFYTGELNLSEMNTATRVIGTPAAVISIVGGWIQPIPGMEGTQGFQLNEDGTASSINMSTLVYSKWTKDSDTLHLSGQSIGNGKTIDFNEKYLIELLDADSLFIGISGSVSQHYGRVK